MMGTAKNKIWHELKTHQKKLRTIKLIELFQENPHRFKQCSTTCSELLLDYSKNFVTEKTLSLLSKLAIHCQLTKKIKLLFQGKFLDNIENQPILHAKLRNSRSITIKNMDNMLEEISNLLLKKQWRGFKGDLIQDIVYLGMGGSYLGPQLVYEAFLEINQDTPPIHFVPDLSAEQTKKLLNTLNPATTLIIVASKSFTTMETLLQFKIFLNWLNDPKAILHNVLAITEKIERARDYGIPQHHIVTLPAGISGRYSLWFSIGLPIVIAFGLSTFKQLRSGAQMMDAHFQKMPLLRNMPVILGLLSVWYINFWGIRNIAIRPYDTRLRWLPNYLQQLHMESNGKRINRRGEKLSYATEGVIFGDVGCAPQHAFHQALFQGIEKIPVDFICSLDTAKEFATYQRWLIASCFSQSHLLMAGDSSSAIATRLKKMGYSEKEIKMLIPRLFISGDVPSNTLLLSKLTPFTLGLLLALYEHKVFVESVIWDIDPFNQPGVETGKIMAAQIYVNLEKKYINCYDDSTNHLLAMYLKSLES